MSFLSHPSSAFTAADARREDLIQIDIIQISVFNSKKRQPCFIYGKKGVDLVTQSNFPHSIMITSRIGASTNARFRWILFLLVTISLQSVHAWTLPLSSFRQRLSVRGYDEKRYGLTNNSTIPDPIEVAAIVGVKPCTMAP